MPLMSDSTTLFNDFTHLNVLIIGDVMIDRYWHGKVRRISPEAPVPVVEWQETEDRLGGAANVALNIQAMGATPYLCSVIGSDTEGVHFLNDMTRHGLNTTGILQSETRQTTVKTRIMVGSQQMLRLDKEITNDISSNICEDFSSHILQIFNLIKIDVIIFQDYNKGVLTCDLIKIIQNEASRRSIPTAVDPKHHNFLEYKNATLFKPNLKEIREAVSFDIAPTVASLNRAARFLRKKLNNSVTMITLSEKGLYLSDDTEGVIYPTQSRQISDVSGAGDTVISVAALCLAVKTDMKTLALLSNIAGSQVCEKAGVVPVDVAQLEAEYQALRVKLG